MLPKSGAPVSQGHLPVHDIKRKIEHHNQEELLISINLQTIQPTLNSPFSAYLLLFVYLPYQLSSF